jgi:peptide/nickel transport system substrate-binding protein
VKRTSIRVAAALLAAALVTILVSAATATAVTNPVPVSGGTLTLGEFSAVTALDPTIGSDVGAGGGDALLALYDTILRYNPATNEYEDVTAKSLVSNAKHTLWTLTLKPGIKFSDGTPYNAEAVKESIERHVAAGSISFARAYVKRIKTITVVNPTTLTFKLFSAWGGFPYLLTTQAGEITSPTAVAKLGTTLNVNPVGAGAGPFILSSFVPGQTLSLVRNPNYWGGKVYLDGLNFVSYPTGAQTLAALQSNAVQFGFFRDQTVIKSIDDSHAAGWEITLGGGDEIALNSTPGHPTSSLLVRRAIAAAIDPNVINQRVYGGDAVVDTSPFPPGFPWGPGVAGTTYNPTLAKSLVSQAEQAGWNGALTLTDSTAPASTTWGLTVQALLQNVGITVNLNTVAPQNLTAAIFTTKDYDIAQSSIGVPANDGAYVQFEENLGGGAATNFFGFSDPTVDAALKQASAAGTAAEKKAGYAAIAKAWNATVPLIADEAIKTRILWSPKLHGVQVTSQVDSIFDKAWLTPSNT